jgi:hypothetical protein
MGMSNQEGGSHVVDNCCSTVNFVAVGVGEWLYDGLFNSYPACRGHHRSDNRRHSGATTCINDLLI